MEFLTPFCKLQNLWLLNNYASFNMGGIDDPRLIYSPYQTQYAQNYESLKIECKATLNPNISFIALKNYLASPAETKRQIIEIINYISFKKIGFE